MKKLKHSLQASNRYFLLATLAASAILFSGCDPRLAVYKLIVGQQEHYVNPPGYAGSELTKLAGRVYTFRWTWYRNIVIDTDEGLVLVDPFNEEAAADLKKHLEREFPGKPVHTLIYTHYHLDHTLGGAVLAPRNVVAHELCPGYWANLPAERAAGVLPATKLIKGDQTLKIGGVEIRLVYLGKSHTDTLYAVYLPAEKILHTADIGLIRTIPPLGGPDYYVPGAFKAYEKLLALDFDTYVPSHFGIGKKDDLRDAQGFLIFVRERCREAIRKYGKANGTGLPAGGEDLQAAFEHVYVPLEAKYGDWHGFDQQTLMLIINHIVGEGLGF